MSDLALLNQNLPAHLREVEVDETTKALMGGGGDGGINGTDAGTSAVSFGSGGGGGGGTLSGPYANGGNGYDGVVIVRYAA